MKTKNYLIVAAAAAVTFTFANRASATDALLSPRANDNQIKTVAGQTTGATLDGRNLAGNVKMREHLASLHSTSVVTEDKLDRNTFALIRPRQATVPTAPNFQVAPVK